MTTQNAGEMTVAECQAWLAARHRPECEKREFSWFDHDAKVWLSGHPVPATLDEAAKVEGFDAMEVRFWPKDGAHAQIVHCTAYKGDDKHDSRRRGILAKVSGTTELEARFRLRVAVEMAERSKA